MNYKHSYSNFLGVTSFDILLENKAFLIELGKGILPNLT